MVNAPGNPGRILLLIAATIMTACAPDSTPAAGTDMYEGETIRIVVPFSPGGTYDLHARVLARHLGKHIPGHPTVVVENMTGAGGMVAAQHLDRRTPPNGMTLGMLTPGVALAPFLEGRGEGIDITRLGIIGSPHIDVPICIFSRSARIHDIGTWRHADTAPRIGMTGPGALAHTIAMVVTAALDLPIKPVLGYKGLSEIRHAIEGGEIEGGCLGLNSFRAIFVPSSAYVVAVQAGEERAADLEQVELLWDEVSTQESRALADLLILVTKVGRYYAFPPGTPAELVDAMGAAFTATMRDPEFIAEATTAQLALNWMPRDEVMQHAQALLATPKNIQALITSALSPARFTH